MFTQLSPKGQALFAQATENAQSSLEQQKQKQQQEEKQSNEDNDNINTDTNVEEPSEPNTQAIQKS